MLVLLGALLSVLARVTNSFVLVAMMPSSPWSHRIARSSSSQRTTARRWGEQELRTNNLPTPPPRRGSNSDDNIELGDNKSNEDLFRTLDQAFSYEGRTVGSDYYNNNNNDRPSITTTQQVSSSSSLSSFRCGFVCLLGAPNQGKSTLVNAVLQEDLCATTFRPQTTRHAILGLLTTNTTQVCLVDTPGILHGTPAYKLQEGMMEAVSGAVRDADVLLIVTDLFATPIPDDSLFQRVQTSRKPKIVCVNKIDLANRTIATTTRAKANAPQDESGRGGGEDAATVAKAVAVWRNLVPDAVAILPVSAKAGPDDPGVVALRRLLTGGPDVPAAIRNLGRPIPGMFRPGVQFVTDEQARELLPPGPPLYDKDSLTDRSERFVASETIRAALFESLQKELPYCCEVQVTKFKEPKATDKRPMIAIDASVIVERDSQKVIVIGKGGEQIKKVGILARQKLEQFFAAKVRREFIDATRGRREESNVIVPYIGLFESKRQGEQRLAKKRGKAEGLWIHEVNRQRESTHSFPECSQDALSF